MSLGADEVLRARKRRAAVAALVAVLSGASVYAACSVLFVGWIQPRRGGLLFSFAQFAMALLPVVGAVTWIGWAWYRLTAPPAPAPVVIWLRRFHQLGAGRTPFHRLLQKACSGVAVPVTVRDTRYPASFTLAVSRLILVTPPLLIGLELLWVLSFVSIYHAFRYLPGALLLSLVLGSMVTGSIGWGAYGVVLRSRGVIPLRGTGALARARDLLDSVERRPHAFPGCVVMQTPDGLWQDVLRLAIQRAAAVLIDVSEASANVDWEIRTALQFNSPDRLILAEGIDTVSGSPLVAGDRNGSDWARKLGVDEATLSLAQRFAYPLYLDRRGGRNSTEALAAVRLESLIAAACASAGVQAQWSRSALIRVSIAAAVLVLVAATGWVARPQPPSAAEVRQIVLTVAGAPAEMIAVNRRQAVPRLPNQPMIYSLRYVRELQNRKEHSEAVIAATVAFSEPENPWRRLALARARILAGQPECNFRAVVAVSATGLKVNGATVKQPDVRARLRDASGVVFIAPDEGVSLERLLEVYDVISGDGYEIVLAGSDIDVIAQRCGARAAELIRLR